jgi:hypothetical protein
MADNLTTPVADGKTLAAKDIGGAGILYPWNLIADGAGADLFGLVTAAPAAFSVLGRLKTIADGVTGATPAGEAYIGRIGGDVLTASAGTPAVTAAAYAAGNVVGGLLTFAGAARTAAGSGLVQAASVISKSAQTAILDLLIFSANPAASTFTDKAALSVAAGDLDKLVGVIHLTDWTSLGTPAIVQAVSAGLPFKLAAGTALYGVLVARAAMTLTSTTDLAPSLRIIPG